MHRPFRPSRPHHQPVRWRHDGDDAAPQADPADLGTAFGLELTLGGTEPPVPEAREDDPRRTPDRRR